MKGTIALVYPAAEVFYYNCMQCGGFLPLERREGGTCAKCENTLLQLQESVKVKEVVPAKARAKVIKVKPVKIRKPTEIQVQTPMATEEKTQVIEPEPDVQADQKPVKLVNMTTKIVGSRSWGCKCKYPRFVKDGYGMFCNACGKPKIGG